MSKILSIDYGEKRIGVAISDELKILAGGVSSLENKGINFVISEIKKLCQENRVAKIIIGLPLSLRGKKTDQTKEVEKFVAFFKKKIKMPVELVDERFSSVLAKKYILKRGGRYRKEEIDTLAAKILLQDYLDKLKK